MGSWKAGETLILQSHIEKVHDGVKMVQVVFQLSQYEKWSMR